MRDEGVIIPADHESLLFTIQERRVRGTRILQIGTRILKDPVAGSDFRESNPKYPKRKNDPKRLASRNFQTVDTQTVENAMPALCPSHLIFIGTGVKKK